MYIRSINKNTMKNLITLLIVLLSINGYSQMSPEALQRFTDSIRNNIVIPSIDRALEKSRYRDSVYMSTQIIDTMKFIVAILNEANYQRKLKGKPALRMGSPEQIRSTTDWADKQAIGSFCGHSSKSCGEDVITEISAVNIFVLWEYKSGKENGELYRNMAKVLVNQWMESPGHYRHLMRTDFKISTVGVSFSKNYSGSVSIFTSLRGHKY